MLFSMQGRCGGSLIGVNQFRNSTGNLVESLGSLALSSLDRMVASPGNSSCEITTFI